MTNAYVTAPMIKFVAVGVQNNDDEGRRWRLLVLEDCDELIRGEAKQSSGQALSRALARPRWGSGAAMPR